MAEDHWITYIWVKAGDDIIAITKLASTDEPKLVFDAPAAGTVITAFEACNQHDVWSTEPITV